MPSGEAMDRVYSTGRGTDTGHVTMTQITQTQHSTAQSRALIK